MTQRPRLTAGKMGDEWQDRCDNFDTVHGDREDVRSPSSFAVQASKFVHVEIRDRTCCDA
jgi:hypothetical protein